MYREIGGLHSNSAINFNKRVGYYTSIPVPTYLRRGLVPSGLRAVGRRLVRGGGDALRVPIVRVAVRLVLVLRALVVDLGGRVGLLTEVEPRADLGR